MKKLLLVLALLVLPIVAFADDQREILLTSDGTLFVAEQLPASDYPDIGATGTGFIRVSVRRGEETKSLVVPGTLESGLHKNPTLAYDNVTKTLFVFWQRSVSLLHSELLFQTMNANLEWGPLAAFGDGRNMRENLRIAVTRKADAPSEDGRTTAVVPQINVHAVWWETDSWDGQQSAQYAMLTVENGAVVETSIHPLLEFIDAAAAEKRFVADSIADVYKHPSLVASPQQDSVLVLFGEPRDTSFNRVRIRPAKIVVNARVHIPVGKSEGRGGVPTLHIASNSRMGTIFGADDRTALYTSDGTKLSYVLFNEGKWTEERAVLIGDAVTFEAAVTAVRHLVDHE
ncbi:MAG TPA: hypothetical protein VJZ00_02505 [Thermoanaerobaculia bacterium]|nr:hypothetical protein [Thermoanaerobaculia bacterium]